MHFHWPKSGTLGNVAIFFGSFLDIFPCNSAHMNPIRREKYENEKKKNI